MEKTYYLFTAYNLKTDVIILLSTNDHPNFVPKPGARVPDSTPAKEADDYYEVITVLDGSIVERFTALEKMERELGKIQESGISSLIKEIGTLLLHEGRTFQQMQIRETFLNI
ncbi:MAG: hypothetical protein COU90_00710 [Candidatus Ryanbacteria bacterium CG10_big_fil_rev_8_21_14_0_10_43_42]|uniref:Uncharacterized protein n=1 Tax=Candidatus Ryanbacteria bacterium CG10_big_fil_rev_8_21_14_0_10_43_42 TaxID=1974864 RepID=A0A2M8KXW3_9BACT|nr:MAG: hypothetical protein COU90_00710 [Candidatus Ryanbacteria bacterium CG10_big_fil_rev_8_21_14_0_10_43_42]